MRKALVCLLLALACTAHAETVTGRVVGVADGDTMTVLVDREQVKVRPIEIDAPEKSQAFGNKSKLALVAMVFGKDVEVEAHGKDKYKRTLGRVVVNGLDANTEIVRQGYAWVYRKYSKNPLFAYLQTSSHSTAKVQSRVADGDTGYRLFFYSLSDPLVMSLYEELIDSGKVTIAFNRREKGLDVLVPIDLKVEDSEPVDGNLKRKISEDAIRGFLKCTVILMEQALSSTK